MKYNDITLIDNEIKSPGMELNNQFKIEEFIRCMKSLKKISNHSNVKIHFSAIVKVFLF